MAEREERGWPFLLEGFPKHQTSVDKVLTTMQQNLPRYDCYGFGEVKEYENIQKAMCVFLYQKRFRVKHSFHMLKGTVRNLKIIFIIIVIFLVFFQFQ